MVIDMKQMLFFMMLSLAAVTIAADDDWSDFWVRVAAERVRTAPQGTQIGSAGIAEFESGRHARAAAVDVFDSLTRTWMQSSALAKFISEPPPRLVILVQ